jgi:hypothetical protein
MTEQEKKQQRANLLIEIDDAGQDFAHLREKALSLTDRLGEIAQKVYVNANLKPSRSDFSAEAELAGKLNPEHQTVLNFDEIGNLIEELRTARKRLFNLAERKAQLSSNGFTMTV